MSKSGFNRIALSLALLWLLISAPLGLVFRPTVPDFEQFYIAGALVSEGNWDALYPRPWRGEDNAGLHSSAKPDWIRISRERGVPDYTHFILPPPSAWLFVPLSWLPPRAAYWSWIFLLTLSCCGVVLSGYRLTRVVFGHETQFQGALALMIALSPMTARAIRIANVSPFVALSIGVSLCSLARKREHALDGPAVFLGALLKYATLVLIPLLLVCRRWKAVLSGAFLGALLLAVTWEAAGPGVFQEFTQVIVPTLSRPSAYAGNQSLSGLIARTHGRPFAAELGAILSFLRLSTLSLLLLTLFFTPRLEWRHPERWMAGACALLSWLLIFSPIAWEHWPIFLCPLWGWLLYEWRQEPEWGVIPGFAILLQAFPAGILQVPGFWMIPVLLPEPLNSTQLWGVCLSGIWSLKSLLQAPHASRVPSAAQVHSEGGPLMETERHDRDKESDTQPNLA